MNIYNAPKNVYDKLMGAGHCTTAGRMTGIILRHTAEKFPPARKGTILNNRRVIGIAINTSVMLCCALVSLLRFSLPDTV